MIFETHAHYDDAAFDEDREEILNKLPEGDISVAVNIASSLDSTRRSIQLAEKYSYMYAAAGVHPEAVAELTEEKFRCLAALISEKKYQKGEKEGKNKIVAVGEIGLDYYWNEPGREVQQYWFERQLKLALELDLPVVIHSRDAAKDTYDMILAAKKYADDRGKILSGVIHCFSYGTEIAREYLSLGFYLGIGGVVTFKNAKKLAEVVKEMPLDRLVLETDSPYLAPEPYRGKRNSSLYLPFIVKKIAEIKQLTEEEVLEAAYRNGSLLYRL